MKLPAFIFLLAISLLLLSNSIVAQNSLDTIASIQINDTAGKEDTPEPAKKTYFKIGGSHLSNAVYNGRKDSSAVPYLSTTIGYYHKSGFYINAGTSLLVGSGNTKAIDMVSFDAGYSFKISDKFDAELTASKLYYTAQSFAVASELKAITGATITYNPGPFTISTGTDLMYSTATDIATNITINHGFEKGTPDKKWTLTPSFVINAGTQYFNAAYYKTRKFTTISTAKVKKGHSAKKPTTVVKTLVFNNQNKYAVLDYEFSMPLTYETNRWGFFINPTYAMPVNGANYELNGKLTKEVLTNTFFLEVGAFIKLFPHRK